MEFAVCFRFSVCFINFLLINGVYSAGDGPVWSNVMPVVKQGDHLSLTCRVNLADDPFGVVRVFRESDNGDRVLVVENNVVKSPFQESGRYSVQFTGRSEVALVLNYTGIRGEDAGKLGCMNINENDIAYTTISVDVPVDELYMVKITPDATEVRTAEDVTVHMTEGQADGVGCVATVDGADVSPNVFLTINGEDRSEMFTLLVNSQKLKPLSGGPDQYFVEAKYTYVTVKPSSEFNQKNLTCVASMYGFPQRMTSVFLDVKYAPIITCSKYKHYGQVGKSFTFQCVLSANPGAWVNWSYGETPETAKKVDITDPTQGMSTLEKPFSEDKTDISLIITKLDKSHFTTFYLKASNDLGNATVSLTLLKGSEPEVEKPVNPPANQENIPQNPETEPVQSNHSPAMTSSSASVFGSLLCALVFFMPSYGICL